MWHSRPGGSRRRFSTSSLAITGTLMAPLPAPVVAGALAGTMLFSLLLDAVKSLAFRWARLA
jgi:hypothetical protein